ncbi:MAG: MCE family protein [Anaerolineae bacterium]|nr:MCE family protein [Gloeobacterales cyanobacterium ES-bin-313]
MTIRGAREGLVGLLILVGIGIFIGLFIWISGGLRQSDYRFTISLADANGLNIGAPVRLRGVRIGQITKTLPKIANVETEVVIDRTDVVIPKNSRFIVSQSGLIGETFIEIFPPSNASVPENGDLKTLEAACKDNPTGQSLVCPGSLVVGYSPTRFQELVRSLDELSNRLDEKFFNELQRTLVKFGKTADDVGFLARKVAVTADTLTATVKGAGDEVDSIGSAARSLQKTVTDLDVVIAEDRGAVKDALNNVAATSKNFKKVSEELQVSINQDSIKKIVANTDATVTNLQTLTKSFSDPGTISSLRETLDSARDTLANVRKITTDLDELTGDPKFRTNLRKLIDGLGGLVSNNELGNPQQAIPALFTYNPDTFSVPLPQAQETKNAP